ncbi:hypothetical protein RUND412_006757 [Rhizina undulata]
MSTSQDPTTAEIRIAYERVCARRRERYFAIHPASETEVTIAHEGLTAPARDGSSIPLRVYVPRNSEAKGVAVYIHGGGWTLGSLNSEDTSCRRLASDAELLVVSIDYRLVPENPYPIPLNDVHDTLLFILSSEFPFHSVVRELGYILVGSSAGAHLCAILTLLARDSGDGEEKRILVAPKGQLLRCPVTVHPECVPVRFRGMYRSWSELKPVEGGGSIALTQEKMNLCHDMLAVPSDDQSNPHAYPLHTIFTSSLPKTYIQKCTEDILQDDAQCYIIGLQDAGVEVKHATYKGDHTFWLKIPEWEDSQRSEADMVEASKWLCGL